MICVVRALGVGMELLSGLDCDFWDFGEMGCDLCGASVGRVGMGVLSGLDCCSPVAKCPKDGVGNGQILGFGEMGCDFFGGDVGRVGRECCLDWTVVRPLPSVQRMESATGEFWDLGRWAVISLAAMLGAWGGSVVWTGLLFARCQVSKGWSRQRANFGIWGDGL